MFVPHNHTAKEVLQARPPVMPFELTPEQRAIKHIVEEIAQQDIAPRAPEVDRKKLFPRMGLAKLAEAGLMGMTVPVLYGGVAAFAGVGADTMSFVLAAETIAGACPSTAFLFVTHTAATFGVAIGGQSEVRASYLPDFAQGRKLAAFAVCESDFECAPSAVETTATEMENHFVVNGSKIIPAGAGEADAYLALVRTGRTQGPLALSWLLTDKESSGLSVSTIGEPDGLRGISSGRLNFSHCLVPTRNLLGKEGGYLPLLTSILGLAALGTAAIAVGIAQVALDASIKYEKQRLMAGQPLVNQQVNPLIAEMSSAVAASRALVYAAAFARERSPLLPPIETFKAKLFATETAIEVSKKALQIHGRRNDIMDFPAERYYRDALALTIHFSPPENLKQSLGQILLA